MGRKKLKLIGLTGGIATGKTTVLKIFSKLGIFTISCDDVYHKLLREDKKLKERLIKVFGNSIVEKGKISKKKLYKVLLASNKNLCVLEKITHPIILKEVFNRIKRATNKKICVVDVPLLFERKLQNRFDSVVTVYCSKKTQLERLKKRKFNRKLVNVLIARQLDLKEKIRLSDFVIYNNDVSKKTLKQQIVKLLHFLY